jgi:hypothetical protein
MKSAAARVLMALASGANIVLHIVSRCWLLCVAALTLASACSGYDSDYIPYAVRGFDVWFHDDRPSCDDVDENDEDESDSCRQGEADAYLGRVEANYLSRASGLSGCNAVAVAEANRRDMGGGEWSYVCCTVTVSSDCVTKVR